MTAEPDRFAPSLWAELWAPRPRATSYALVRFAMLRLLGLVYLVAFSTLAFQGPALIGEHGLLPAGAHLEALRGELGSTLSAALRNPSVFWLGASDAMLLSAAWIGMGLSAACLAGFANAVSLSLLWFLQLSILAVGQDFYGFGWEIQLCETGFLAIFLAAPLDPRPFPARPPPVPIVALNRFLIARIMLGAGLIKLRGDPCWTELTCLDFHYETQPIPGPLSPWLHAMPAWFHRMGVGFTHLVELGAPWFVFGPRRARIAAGLAMLGLQVILILSGNLSFLNWLTIVPILACFDDAALGRIFPRGLRERAATPTSSSRGQRVAVAVVTALIATLSIQPLGNLVSRRQIMNTSFDRLHLVNTYGAFGSVGRERDEIVIEGTADAVPDDDAEWRAYELPCKPGDPNRRPCWITPYHLRLDWLMWFAAMRPPAAYPWVVHLCAKLLDGDPVVKRLLARDPFPVTPPRWVRAQLYRYAFEPPGSGATWRRQRVREHLPPLEANDPRLHEFLRRHGWARPGRT